MKEIANAKKVITDKEIYDTLKYYEEFKSFLSIYNKINNNKGIKIDENTDPIAFLRRKLEKDIEKVSIKNGNLKLKKEAVDKYIDDKLKKYSKFSETMKKTESFYDQVDFSDITSKRTRNAIGGIISDSISSRGNEKVTEQRISKNLDYIAVIKSYGLYKTVEEIADSTANISLGKLLEMYGVTHEQFDMAFDKMDIYDLSKTKQAYNSEKGNENTPELVHTVAALLEMEPARAEEVLIDLKQIDPKEEEKTDESIDDIIDNNKTDNEKEKDDEEESEISYEYKEYKDNGVSQLLIDEYADFKKQLDALNQRISEKGATQEILMDIREIQDKITGVKGLIDTQLEANKRKEEIYEDYNGRGNRKNKDSKNEDNIRQINRSDDEDRGIA